MKILLLGKNGQVGWELQRALAPLGAANPARVGISMDGVTCSSELRCPALDVQVGGGMKLCKDKNLC